MAFPIHWPNRVLLLSLPLLALPACTMDKQSTATQSPPLQAAAATQAQPIATPDFLNALAAGQSSETHSAATQKFLLSNQPFVPTAPAAPPAAPPAVPYDPNIPPKHVTEQAIDFPAQTSLPEQDLTAAPSNNKKNTKQSGSKHSTSRIHIKPHRTPKKK
jgi:hypothetical protein